MANWMDSFLSVVQPHLHYVLYFIPYVCLTLIFHRVLLLLRPFKEINGVTRALVVTAHPDDECMFFGPVILQLLKRRCQIYLLCLTPGNYEKKGKLRKEELWKSCSILGIPDENITLIRDTRLPDDPVAKWPRSVVAQLLLHHIQMMDIDLLVTFDGRGVSSHVNHCAIYYSILSMYADKLMPSNCKVYCLESISIFRKYCLLIDVPFTYIFATYGYLANLSQWSQIKKAMAAHQTQFVWFRHLYVFFSRYLFVNTLRKVAITSRINLDRIG